MVKEMYYIVALLIIVAIIGLIVIWRIYKDKGVVIAYSLWSVLVIAVWYLVNV